MKKIILLLVLIASATSVYSQRIKKDEFDKFNKVRVIETNYETMYKKMNLASLNTKNGINFALRKSGEKYILLADIKNENNIAFIEGNGMTLLLDNDSTIWLKNNYIGISKTPSIGNAVYASSFTTTFSIDDKYVQPLKEHKIKAVRIEYSAGSFDGDIRNENQSNLQKMFQIIEKRSSKPIN
jgi:hypothetical protein